MKKIKEFRNWVFRLIITHYSNKMVKHDQCIEVLRKQKGHPLYYAIGIHGLKIEKYYNKIQKLLKIINKD